MPGPEKNSFDFPRVLIFSKAHHLTSKEIKKNNNNNQQQFERDQKLGVFFKAANILYRHWEYYY